MNGYVAESHLTGVPGGHDLELATALGLTPSGRVDNPVFFTGFLSRPDVASSGLLAVADVAASRYADAGLMARIANLDPVVTAGGDRLRFESFSACNSVHARFDLLREGLGTGEVGFGTTNVDINQPLRTDLARVGRDTALHLAVGKTELRASSLAGTHVERKVNLPDRWVQGLVEVPLLTASMTRVAELRGPAIARFLASLPRVAPPGPTLHVLPAPSGWRVTTRSLPNTFPLPGVSRLRGCDRVVRHSTRLTVHAGAIGTTAWVFDLPGSRFTLVLSPNPYRGFSGEGTLLTLLTRDDAEEHGRRLLAELGWAPVIDAAALTRSTGLESGEVASGLAWLSASGRLGYDLYEQAWFHRELPVDSDLVIQRNPRLRSARALVEKGAVEGIAGNQPRWRVRGSHGKSYSVRRRVTDTGSNTPGHQLQCECAWETEHAGDRGPCKHVLSVIISLRS